MNYPAVYTAIPEEEMVYLAGGEYDFKGLFDWAIGNYLRDTVVMGGIRSAVWNSVKQSSVAPLVSWWQSVDEMSLAGHALFLYGCYRVYETVASFNKKS